MNRAIVWIVVLSCAAGCHSSEDEALREALTSEISRLLEEDQGKIFRMSELTDWPWERVFVFGPTSTAQDIEEALGFEWAGAPTLLEWMDHVSLLVFTDRGQAVAYLHFPRRLGDFFDLGSNYSLSREEAVFSVEREHENRVVVRPVSLDRLSHAPIPNGRDRGWILSPATL